MTAQGTARRFDSWTSVHCRSSRAAAAAPAETPEGAEERMRDSADRLWKITEHLELFFFHIRSLTLGRGKPRVFVFLSLYVGLTFEMRRTMTAS